MAREGTGEPPKVPPQAVEATIELTEPSPTLATYAERGPLLPPGRIAFVSTGFDGADHIFAMDTDGFGRTQITKDGLANLAPSWSPDGHLIAYASDRDSATGTLQIYVIDTVTSRVSRVTRDSLYETSPSWSPDRGSIAFLTEVNPFYVAMARVDGSGFRRLTNDETMQASPAWSPDGNGVAYLAARNGCCAYNEFRIVVFSLEGGGTKEPGDRFAMWGSLAWSPDSGRLAFTGAEDCKLYVLDLASNHSVRITDGPGCDRNPSWSPDAQYIAFDSTRDDPFPHPESGTPNLYVVGPQSGRTYPLLEGPFAYYQPNWCWHCLPSRAPHISPTP